MPEVIVNKTCYSDAKVAQLSVYTLVWRAKYFPCITLDDLNYTSENLNELVINDLNGLTGKKKKVLKEMIDEMSPGIMMINDTPCLVMSTSLNINEKDVERMNALLKHYGFEMMGKIRDRVASIASKLTGENMNANKIAYRVFSWYNNKPYVTKEEFFNYLAYWEKKCKKGDATSEQLKKVINCSEKMLNIFESADTDEKDLDKMKKHISELHTTTKFQDKPSDKKTNFEKMVENVAKSNQNTDIENFIK